MNELAERRNIMLVIAYDGSRYHGWQRQAEAETVQEHMERSAGRVMGHPVVVFGAGRTDAGVHAAGQVANFYTTNLAIPLTNLRRALSSKLPADITVVSARQVSQRFHASRSAIGKTYRYRIHLGPLKPVMQAGQVYHYHRQLQIGPMVEAARRLLGEHDFRGFAFSAEKRENTVRTVTRCDVCPCEQELHVYVSGTGFLYKMVRNIVGTLMEVGRGRWGPERIDYVLTSRNRNYAGPTAPPGGLCMMSVNYPPELLVPERLTAEAERPGEREFGEEN